VGTSPSVVEAENLISTQRFVYRGRQERSSVGEFRSLDTEGGLGVTLNKDSAPRVDRKQILCSYATKTRTRCRGKRFRISSQK
jgi:hypothetical protein